MKGFKFFTLKKRNVFIVLLCIFVLMSCCVSYFTVKTISSPKQIYCIVIDAGHGGRDGGCEGDSGVTESELNLKYARRLAKLCEEFGMRVVLTRKDMNGLYDENATNKKKSEMEKRRKIINESGGDIMVSIHMNSFPLSSCEGACVFYAKGSERGFDLAKSVQKSVCGNFSNARNYVSVGDYYVLNFSNIPSILIECGFLSNPVEEKLLQDDDYCEKFCYSILSGIIGYFQF